MIRELSGAAAVLLLVQGCTNVISTPANPSRPLPVFLVDHGRHASLVLPRGDDGMVRYAYGDWEYFARAKTGPGEASAAVLWPTRAALGRRSLPGLPGESGVRRHLFGIERLYRVVVESRRIERLRARLDSIYESNIETLIYNSTYDLEFVHHPRSYWVLHNSNLVVAAWLEELGCRVSGPGILSNWRLEPRRNR
ncbi:MAG: hypothetical protein GWN99_08950 [Gemmatimonadetes bacterium]|nr:hypothetical protein [Gemmatimonadota bacterium]NIW75437.1 hypothetical protein [Gemmatimonadota bacterium]NIY45634.1 hypothetical protein [Gemmatimonadota bacterium]